MNARASRHTRVAGRGAKRIRQPRKAVIAKALACTAVGALFFALPLFDNTAIGYAPLLAYIVVLVLSFAYVRVLKRSLVFDMHQAEGECRRGEAIDFKLSVENKSAFPVVRLQVVFFMSDLFGGEGASELHYLALGPRTSKVFEFAGRFDHIGSYNVGIKRISISDLFGLFAVTMENDDLARVDVVPRVFDIAGLPLLTDASLEAKRTFATVIDDGMDYSSVREYQPGDPIKAIHWKLSSRMPSGEYLTRLYETNANPGMAVIVDFDAPHYEVAQLMSIYDTIVECAFTIERFARLHGFDAEFVFRDSSKRCRRYFTPFGSKRQEILDRMPVIFSPGSGEEALHLVRDEVKSTFAQFNLIVCTSVISARLVQSLLAANTGKRCPMLIAVIPSGVEEERRRQMVRQLAELDRVGIYYRVIADTVELERG